MSMKPESVNYTCGPFTFRWYGVPKLERRQDAVLTCRHPASSDWLVMPAPIGSPCEFAPYAPLSIANLHRRFAKIPARNPERILEFARQFGLLGAEGIGVLVVLPGSEALYEAESLRSWRKEIARMRKLVEMLDDVNERHTLWPRKLVKVDAGRKQIVAEWECDEFGSEFEFAERQRVDESPDTPSAKMAASEVLQETRRWIVDTVNSRLEGRLSARIGLEPGDTLRIYPCDLLAAMYLSLALELQGRLTPRKCARPDCDRTFVPTRPKQRFCSENCQQRTWLRSRREAKKKET